MNKDFNVPEGISPDGLRAYQVIRAQLNGFKFSDGEDMSGGGCTGFYTPEKWESMGNEYGKKSVLIVVYDGGDLRGHFNMDAAYDEGCMLIDYLRSEGKDTKGFNCYESIEKMSEALRAAGFFVEECTGYYAAVYKL